MLQNISEIEYISDSQELRSNTWTFCIYPDDSAPDNYEKIISNWLIPVLMSPIHDKDINGNGMEKKKHIHLMLYFGKGANKSYKQVMKYVNQVNGCPCEVVHNSVGLIRYFIHKDNPDKFQYSISDLKSFYGFEYSQAFETSNDENVLFDYIEKFCEDNRIYNYYQLTLILKRAGLINELNFLRRHSMHIRYYLTDKYQVMRRLGYLHDLDQNFINPKDIEIN